MITGVQFLSIGEKKKIEQVLGASLNINEHFVPKSFRLFEISVGNLPAFF